MDDDEINEDLEMAFQALVEALEEYKNEEDEYAWLDEYEEDEEE